MTDRELRADCSRCFGLCCVTLSLTRSADFAIDKPAGEPCPNLADDSRCTIHDRLRPLGFPGCIVYDCFGAGQHVSQVIFGGRHWRDDPDVASSMFALFPVVRALHELLRYLVEALTFPVDDSLRRSLAEARDATERLTGADQLAALDMDAHRTTVNALLQQASEVARSAVSSRCDHRGADLVGADLRRAALSAANLRGARLVGADLRDVDLTLADVTGADLRAARLGGADLRGALFLIQPQLDAAIGDAATRLPPALERPRHWPDKA